VDTGVGVPIARLIGFEAKDIADWRATVVLAAGPQHANPMGTLHGGILCDIADAAMGIAFASTLAPDESFTTVELKINFLSPALAGTTQRGRNGRAAGPHDRLRRRLSSWMARAINSFPGQIRERDIPFIRGLQLLG
jgi:uncharacterized protein (TIGR00369 family)